MLLGGGSPTVLARPWPGEKQSFSPVHSLRPLPRDPEPFPDWGGGPGEGWLRSSVLAARGGMGQPGARGRGAGCRGGAHPHSLTLHADTHSLPSLRGNPLRSMAKGFCVDPGAGWISAHSGTDLQSGRAVRIPGPASPPLPDPAPVSPHLATHDPGTFRSGHGTTSFQVRPARRAPPTPRPHPAHAPRRATV